MALLATPENLHSLSSMKGDRGVALRRYKKLEDDRSSWRSHWMELSDYLSHRRGRYLIEDSQNTRGRKRNNKIIDSTGTQALRTMVAGMMSGMTSPARPWHRRTIAGDPELMNRQDVKEWISQVEKIERAILNKSNFYNSMHAVYTELGSFGTGPLYRQQSFDSVIRFRPFTAGEYVIAEDHKGGVDTVGRYFTMTVSQVVEKFGIQPDGRTIDWTGISATTKKLWESKNYDSLVPIIHMIEPRRSGDRDIRKRDQLNMPVKSIYFEHGGDGDDLLFEGGFKKMPIYVPRWDVLYGDVYGRSPGMDTLGDIKQLQHQQKRKAQAIDKMVNPPMVASVNLRGKPSTLPGGNTYVDPTQGGQGFQPAYTVQPRINEMLMDIQEVQERIQRGFYADLFAMMINSDRRQMTATEVAERHEEKLVLLGPVLQRLNVELLDPLLDDVFDFASEAGLLPTPPEALHGQELKVEYISLLAQAQQAVAATTIERTMSFAGNLSAVFQEVVDVVDADYALREYSEILGNDPKLLKDAETVQAMREGRQQEAAQAAAMEQGMAVAQGAKVLSETDSTNPNALTDLLGAGGGLQ